MAQQAPSDLGAKPAQGYHHGDLRAALIDAAKALIAERGVDGFSLRAAARQAGVSAAAPAHHFGDARGLLTAVATGAFDAFTAALIAGADAGGMVGRTDCAAWASPISALRWPIRRALT
ncbi:MAG: helix-turn-helix transcriptional regulator [Rhodobacteraceae bacterium]|nr:helix-turn-helix transcriptional regulator [Paracoccaceae bacterium]